MKLNREHFRVIIFYNFRGVWTQQQCIDEGPVFVDGMVNSTEVVVHSKTNFVKVVQNQLLFRDAMRQLILQDRHVIYR